ncbi:unnamed protein product, partial [Vitis vinifera]
MLWFFQLRNQNLKELDIIEFSQFPQEHAFKNCHGLRTSKAAETSLEDPWLSALKNFAWRLNGQALIYIYAVVPKIFFTKTMEDIWLYTSLTVVFLLFAFKVLLHRRRNHGNLPPSPPAFPVLGHLHLMKLPFHRALQTLSEKYGPIFALRLGSRPVVVVSSPSAVEECFTKNDIVLANHWRNLRRLCSIEILSSNRLNMFLGIRSDELKPLFSNLTFNTMTRTIAGKRYHGEEVGTEEVKQFREIIGEIFELAGNSNPMDYLPILEWVDYGGYKKKLMKISRRTEAMLQYLIDEHRNSKKRGLEDSTTIDHLLSLQKSEPEYYTDEIIKGLVLILILGGSESTAVTIEWAMALLLNHPDALNKVREEINIHVGQGRLMEESDLSKLGYLQNVISETLRLCPAAPLLLPHMTSSHCQVGGFDIPKGTMLITNAWAIHRDPKAIPLEAMCKARDIIKMVV